MVAFSVIVVPLIIRTLKISPNNFNKFKQIQEVQANYKIIDSILCSFILLLSSYMGTGCVNPILIVVQFFGLSVPGRPVVPVHPYLDVDAMPTT